MALEQANAQQDLNKSLLRIAYIMQQSKALRDTGRGNGLTVHSQFWRIQRTTLRSKCFSLNPVSWIICERATLETTVRFSVC